MLRDAIFKRNIGFNKEFRFRGEEPGRLENFSDAVFALALTLVLISTTPPTNFEQVKLFAWEIIPFVFCVALIVLIWHQHFVFFYRYGLRNPKVIVLNAAFLVIVLFYVYPLKYLTRAILIPVALLFDQDTLLIQLRESYSGGSMSALMVIYGLGATTVFFILALLYLYASANANALELNSIERFDTRASMQANLLMGSIPLLSVIIALTVPKALNPGMWAGLSYFLYFPIMMTFWTIKTRKRTLVVSEGSESSLVQSPEEEASPDQFEADVPDS